MSQSVDDTATPLPPWTLALNIVGGVITYLAVGSFLQGPRFGPELESLLTEPDVFAQGGFEAVGPYVLLIIPAVLGALGTRGMLRILFAGFRRGDPPETIAKALAMYLAGAVLLVLAGLFSSSKRSY